MADGPSEKMQIDNVKNVIITSHGCEAQNLPCW